MQTNEKANKDEKGKHPEKLKQHILTMKQNENCGRAHVYNAPFHNRGLLGGNK